MSTTTISSKYQVVIPKAVRKQLNVTVGKRVTIEALDEHRAVISFQIDSQLKRFERMRGLGKEVWQVLGGGEKYLENERNSWDK